MIKIIADTGCDLTDDMKKFVEHIPLTIQFGDKHYIDDENLNYEEFIDYVRNFKGERKTAAPSPSLYYEAYKQDADIFAITLSSKLSGSYNSAVTAKNMYIEDFGEKFINVIDSFSAAGGESIIALKIKELYDKGLSSDEISEKITEFVSEIKTYFVLEDYSTFVNTGRLNPYVAKLASMLSIIPLCGAKDGQAVLIGKAVGQKKAYSKLADMMSKEGKDFENKTLAITHVDCYEKALEFKQAVCKKIKFKDVIIMKATGLCSFYSNYGGLMIAF